MKRLSDQTLYEILEVPVDAPGEEIERAYARAVALYGPGSLATYSLVSSDEARLLNNRIEEAHAVLLDPAARAGYDERIGVRTPTVVPAAPAAPATTPWPPPAPVKATPPVAPEPAAPHDPPPADPAPFALTAEAPPPVPPEAPVTPPFPPPGEPGPGAVAAFTPAPEQQAVLPLTAVVAAPEAPAAPPAAAPPAVPPAPLPAAPIATPPPFAAAAPILLKRELPTQREVVIPEGAAWTGEMLRQVREARGLSTAALSDRTKVLRYHIENIEADRFEKLPAGVYLRGILMSLARELRLDGQKVARSYQERMAAEVGPAPRK